jgi:hypothetical protein
MTLDDCRFCNVDGEHGEALAISTFECSASNVNSMCNLGKLVDMFLYNVWIDRVSQRHKKLTAHHDWICDDHRVVCF